MPQENMVKYVRILIQMSVAIVLTYAGYHAWVGQYDLAQVEIAIGAANLVVLYILRKGAYVVYVMHAVMVIGMTGLFLNMMKDPSISAWLGCLVIGSFALFGRKLGVYWVVVFNVCLIAFMLVDANQDVPMYEVNQALHIVFASLWLSVVAFFAYKNSMQQHEALIQEETERGRKHMAKTLSSGVAHLINNEMLGIIGKAEMIQFRMKNQRNIDDIEEVIGLAIQASEHAKKLVSYTQANKQQNTKMDVYDTLHSVVHAFKKTLPPDIEIKMAARPSFSTDCYGDEVEMANVFHGILENGKEAIVERWDNSDHLMPGHLTISLREENNIAGAVEKGLDIGRYLCISFADDGCGIAPDIRDKIFEPFMTTKFKGRGLGLAAAHGILKGHGGFIEMESDVGKGTLFYVWLPVQEGAKQKR